MLMFFTTASKARRSRDYRRLEGIVPSCIGIWTKSTALIRYEVCFVVATSLFLSAQFLSLLVRA